MGLPVTRDTFDRNDVERFQAKVDANLIALDRLLRREGFGEGPASVGAEVEFYLIDQNLHALNANEQLLEQMQDPCLTVELNRFNLEYNLPPQPLQGEPWRHMEQALQQTLLRLNEKAAALGGCVTTVGILPTLRRSDFHAGTMTDLARYRGLSNGLRQLRGGPFRIDIDGEDPLVMSMDDVTLEGASTSFQFHWRVAPTEFADCFNAVQMATPVILALSGNSPSLFGHLLWDETRIALFKQSIDTRLTCPMPWHHPARVSFGEGWVREGAWELFAASVALYPPILPVVGDEDPVAVVDAGGVPQLDELRLHQGTTWPWNRAIYDPADGGHLRIEMRALPSGPTGVDMSANALFLLGAAMALRPNIRRLAMLLPFRYAEQNFYRAAQQGLDARLLWPSGRTAELRETPVVEIARQLLGPTREALARTALESHEIERLLGIIEGRLDQRITPARWQRRMLAQQSGRTREEALQRMLARYLEQQASQKPLHEWSLQP